jgi:adenylate kinase
MVWILLGAPGAGKGTQAERLARHLELAHVSTGELLRKEVGAGSELGRKAQAFMDRGQLVPDELILGMVRAKLEGTGCILDGYPRNVAQAESLEQMLCELGLQFGGVINLEVSEPVLVERIAGRQEGRVDDTEETVRARLQVYHRETAPLVAYYRQQGLLRGVDGEGTIEEIQARIHAITDQAAGASG